MPIQDLYQALQMFKSGMQEYAVGQALAQGQEELNKMNAQLAANNADEKAKLNAMNLFSQDFAMKLGQASGGNAALVESIAGRMGISVGQQAQQLFAKEQQATSQAFTREQSDREFGQQVALEQMRQAGKKGQVGTLLGPQLQLQPDSTLTEKESVDLKSAVENVFNLDRQLNDYERLLGEEGTAYIGKNATKLETMQQGLLFNLKQVEGLGALQKADLDALEPMIPDATSWTSNIKGILRGIPGVSSQKEVVREKVKELRNQYLNKIYNNLAAKGALPKEGSKLDQLFKANEIGSTPTDIPGGFLEKFKGNPGIKISR